MDDAPGVRRQGADRAMGGGIGWAGDAAVVAATAGAAGLLAGAALIVSWRFLTGRINTRGMLREGGTGRLSAPRLQLLLFTFIAAGHVVATAAETGRLAAEPEALAVLAGSHGLFLGSKAGVVRRLRAFAAVSRR